MVADIEHANRWRASFVSAWGVRLAALPTC
jgi:hypothetical protein